MDEASAGVPRPEWGVAGRVDTHRHEATDSESEHPGRQAPSHTHHPSPCTSSAGSTAGRWAELRLLHLPLASGGSSSLSPWTGS